MAQLRLQGCRCCWAAAVCAAGVLVMAGSLQAIQQRYEVCGAAASATACSCIEEQRAIEPQTTSTLLTCDASMATAAEPTAEASSAGSWLEHLHLAGGHVAVACWCAGVFATKWVLWYVAAHTIGLAPAVAMGWLQKFEQSEIY